MSAGTGRLLDAWLAPAGAGDPKACIATTFTFDAEHFEEECLARFLNLDETVLADSSASDAALYLVQREHALEDVLVSVIVDRGQAAPASSHRWDVIAAGAPPGGVQHAKVSVLLWEHVTRVIIASANLTTSGYRRNIEAFAVFDLPSTDDASGVHHDVADFLGELLREHTRGSDDPASPRARAFAALALLRSRVDEAGGSSSSNRTTSRVVHTLRRADLLEQAFDGCWRGAAPTDLRIASPYWLTAAGDNRTPHGLQAARNRLSSRRLGTCELLLPVVRMPDLHTRVEAPEELKDSAGRGTLVLKVWPRAGVDQDRDVHAKVLQFRRPGWSLLLVGSANCTAAGLGLAGHARNVELGIALADRDLQWLPRSERMPAGELHWEQPPDAEATAFDARLPAKFREALWHPFDDQVVVELGPEVEPSRWWIHDGDRQWFSADEHQGGPLAHDLRGSASPAQLVVTWMAGEERLTAPLIVNVADAKQLLLRPRLSDLTFEQLLTLLSAGGRFRAVLRRLMRERAGRLEDDVQAIDLDPHARVDTRSFVLQRSRRIGAALDGLRHQLSRPVAHEDAVFRRLHGPFGPLAFRRALDEQLERGTMSAHEHVFAMAELVLALKRVEWHLVGSELNLEWCTAQLEAVLGELLPVLNGQADALGRYARRVKELA